MFHYDNVLVCELGGVWGSLTSEQVYRKVLTLHLGIKCPSYGVEGTDGDVRLLVYAKYEQPARN